MRKWKSMEPGNERWGTIKTNLAFIWRKREFSFRNCPEILELIIVADNLRGLDTTTRRQRIRAHEQELGRLIASKKTLVDEVRVVENYLDSLSTDRGESPRRRIISELRALGDREFNFDDCPDILELVTAADPRETLEGSGRHQHLLKREREIQAVLDGAGTLDEKVPALEQFIVSLSRGIPEKSQWSRTPLTSAWGDGNGDSDS